VNPGGESGQVSGSTVLHDSARTLTSAQLHLAWRPTAKVRALERDFPLPHDRSAATASVDPSRSTSLASDAVDLAWRW
jgi:hypothetical protein